MSCQEIREQIVSDDPAERAAFERHASACAACGRMMEEHGEILLGAREWQSEDPAPSDRLEGRISAALEGEGLLRASGSRGPHRLFLTGWRPVWAPLAALFLVAVLSVGLLQLLGPSSVPEDPEFSSLLRQIDTAERSYVEAVARLEQRAARVLQRAADPNIPSDQAALLLAYESRLSHLEAVIEDVRGFLDEHPGHAGGHKVLIAAYREKTEVLEEVIHLELGDRT